MVGGWSTTTIGTEVVFALAAGHEALAEGGLQLAELAFGSDQVGCVGGELGIGGDEGLGAAGDAVAVLEAVEPAGGDGGVAVVGSRHGAEDGTGGVCVAAEVDDLGNGVLEAFGAEQDVEGTGDEGGGKAVGGASAVLIGSVAAGFLDQGDVGLFAFEFEHRLDMRDGDGDGAAVVATCERVIRVVLDEEIFGLGDVVSELEEEAGFAGLAAGEALDGVSDGDGAGEAADIAVGDEAGLDDGVAKGFEGLIHVVEGEGGDPHRGTDAGGVLAALKGEGAFFEFFDDATEGLAGTAVGPEVEAAWIGELDVGVGDPVGLDGVVPEQALGEDESLLGVVGIEAWGAPAEGLFGPGSDAVDVIDDGAVGGADLLKRESLEGSA